MDAYNVKKLNDVVVREQYQVKNWNRFRSLENLIMMMMMMWISVGLEKY
jgi:hypothetical protein